MLTLFDDVVKRHLEVDIKGKRLKFPEIIFLDSSKLEIPTPTPNQWIKRGDCD